MTRAKIAVLISGSGTNMAALLYAARAQDCPFEVVLVASNNPDAAGLKLAGAEGLATFVLPHKGMAREDHDLAMDAAIRSSGAEFVALAGYMRILTPRFVSRWEGHLLNIHPSLLPKYPGLHTHERALKAGDKQAGCTVHLVTADLDLGPVLGQTAVAVLPGDTPETLAARVLIAEHQLYSRVLAAFVTRERNPDWLLDQIRVRALALPEVEERTSHGSPGFSLIGGKFFAYFKNNVHNDGIIALLVKTSGAEEQAMLIDQDSDLYYRPPFLGPSGWIGIRLDLGDTDWSHTGDWLARSWRAVAPKKLTRLLDVADEF